MTSLPVPAAAPAASANAVVCSFDVFDTVLTRAVSPPTAAFLLEGERAGTVLPTGYSPRAFAEARRAAEQRALRWHGDRMTLDAIYRELRDTNPDVDWDRVQDVELEVERDLLTPVPEGCDLLQRCRAAGHSIIFMSDMYLPAAFIQAQLEAHDLWQSGDRLFVSCEHGCKKGKGLFDVVYDTLGIAPEALTHYGNCRSADVRGAQAQGSTAVHVTEANPNRYEAALEGYAQSTSGLSALIAGAARHARLHTSASTRHEQALRTGAASVLAPVCTAFVMWLLQEAKRHGLERLYLTARDGHVLLPIAQRLAPLMGVKCEFRYLYLSRASIATVHPDPEVLERSLEFETTSVEAPMERLEETLGRPRERKEPRRQDVLVQEAPVRYDRAAEAAPTSTDAHSLFCQYLRQEGLDRPLRSGFVDVGWKGTTHSLLNDLLLSEGMIETPMPGLFFGMSAKQQPFASHRTAYFFDEHRHTGYRDVLLGSGIYTLLEMFCTADHGSAIGYEQTDHGVQPVLESTWPARMENWGLPVVRETVDAFLDGLTQDAALLHASADLRPALAEVIQMFWQTPRMAEAEAWGQFPREQGHAHQQGTKPLAPRYPWTAPALFARHGPSAHEKMTHKFSWPAASLLRSHALVRQGVTAALTARAGTKRIYHALRRRWPGSGAK